MPADRHGKLSTKLASFTYDKHCQSAQRRRLASPAQCFAGIRCGGTASLAALDACLLATACSPPPPSRYVTFAALPGCCMDGFSFGARATQENGSVETKVDVSRFLGLLAGVSSTGISFLPRCDVCWRRISRLTIVAMHVCTVSRAS